MTKVLASMTFCVGMAVFAGCGGVTSMTPAGQTSESPSGVLSESATGGVVHVDPAGQAYKDLSGALLSGRVVAPETLKTLCGSRHEAKESDGGESRALYIRGLCGLTGYGSGGQHVQQAISDLEAGAFNGHLVSVLTLAVVYREGVLVNASDSRSCFWSGTAATLGASVGHQGWKQCLAAGVTADPRGSSNAERTAEQQRQAWVTAQRQQQWQRQQEFRSWKNAQADERFQQSQWRRQQERFERYAQEDRDRREERRRQEW